MSDVDDNLRLSQLDDEEYKRYRRVARTERLWAIFRENAGTLVGGVVVLVVTISGEAAETALGLWDRLNELGATGIAGWVVGALGTGAAGLTRRSRRKEREELQARIRNLESE